MVDNINNRALDEDANGGAEVGPGRGGYRRAVRGKGLVFTAVR